MRFPQSCPLTSDILLGLSTLLETTCKDFKDIYGLTPKNPAPTLLGQTFGRFCGQNKYTKKNCLESLRRVTLQNLVGNSAGTWIYINLSALNVYFILFLRWNWRIFNTFNPNFYPRVKKLENSTQKRSKFFKNFYKNQISANKFELLFW